MTGRRRDLSVEERRLWDRVAATARPLGRRPPTLAPPPPDDREPAAGDPAPAATTPRRTVRPRQPAPPREPAAPLTGIDRRTGQRLRRGALEVDARVDLHGLRQEAAHAALRRFLAEAQARGHRLVLVITGKGVPGADEPRDFMSDPRGVLRRQVPHWLQGRELRAFVTGFRPAHIRHGGDGALYVRVRRAR